MHTKHAITSKTVWVNALVILIVGLIPGGKAFVAENPQATVVLVGAVNIALRWLTNRGIHLKL